MSIRNNRWIRVMVITAALLSLAAAGRAQTGISGDDDKARLLAAAGKWDEAIETYGKFLGSISPQEYRDKKDFEWVMEEYEKNDAGNLDRLKKAAVDLLAKHKGQEIFDWRLHRFARGDCGQTRR
jgi:hypothetical protein